MKTWLDIIDGAKADLVDKYGLRYSPDELFRFAKEGVLEAYTLRPDLRLGSYGTAIPDDDNTGDAFPLGDEYASAISAYVVFRAETRDDEHVKSQKAALMYQRFQNRFLKA